jgi:predicted nucleotidyltransferase
MSGNRRSKKTTIMENEVRNIRLEKLMEREKELNCLYSIESLLINDEMPLDKMMQKLVYAIPPGWQYPSVCECRIVFEDKTYETDDFEETEYMQSTEIIVGEHVAGRIDIAYTQLIRLHRGSAFLQEEQKLLNTIAGTLGRTIFRRKLKSTLDYLENSKSEKSPQYDEEKVLNPDSDEHWKWRYDIVNKLSQHLDLDRFGLKGVYLIGSTKNANAGPGSDIDILAHSVGNKELEEKFKTWMEGWGLCLNEMNFMKSGYRSNDSLIDLHIITDKDIKKNDSYACLITAVSDRARPVKIKEQKN